MFASIPTDIAWPGDNRSTCVPAYQQTKLGPERKFSVRELHVQTNQHKSVDATQTTSKSVMLINQSINLHFLSLGLIRGVNRQ